MGNQNLEYTAVPNKEKNEVLSAKCEAPKGLGMRHLQVLLLFLSLAICYSMRAQLSVTMVAMTGGKLLNSNCNDIINRTDVSDNLTGKSDTDTKCLHTKDIRNMSKWSVYRTYKWDKSSQEMILYAFFVGYTGMMIPMGIIVQKYGGKLPIMVALGVNGVISLLFPWIPLIGGWIMVCICRLLQGISQACIYPGIHNVIAKWVPLSERGRLSTYAYTGSQFGTILAFQFSGFLAGSSLGWPSSFWVLGTGCLICLGLVWWFCSSSPHEHSRISYEELAYIMGNESAGKPKKLSTPWKHVLTCKAVWGIVITQIGSTMAYLLLLTQIPTYMNGVLGVNIKENGLYSSLPYIAMYVMMISFGYLSDYLNNNNIMTLVNIRRVGNSIGMVLPAVFLIAFGFVKNTLVAVIFMILCLGTHSGIFIGFHINHVDLAPNFAGPMMALGNMIGNLTGLLVPFIVVNIVRDDVKNQHRWQIVFIIIGTILIVTNTVYVIFVKASTQKWNYYGDDGNAEQSSTIAEKPEKVVVTKEDSKDNDKHVEV